MDSIGPQSIYGFSYFTVSWIAYVCTELPSHTPQLPEPVTTYRASHQHCSQLRSATPTRSLSHVATRPSPLLTAVKQGLKCAEATGAAHTRPTRNRAPAPYASTGPAARAVRVRTMRRPQPGRGPSSRRRSRSQSSDCLQSQAIAARSAVEAGRRRRHGGIGW